VSLEPHTALLPTWVCRECSKPWPCRSARERLIAEHRGNLVSLVLYMSGQYVDASRDLYGSTTVVEALYDRFIAVVTEVTAGRRDEQLVDESHLDRILPAFRGGTARPLLSGGRAVERLDSVAGGSIGTSAVAGTSRKCGISAYRLNLSCYRDSQFYVAAEAQGAIGLYACTSHLGQAIVAATVHSGRTSVLAMSLMKDPRPPTR
jgi:hypothetical protein